MPELAYREVYAIKPVGNFGSVFFITALSFLLLAHQPPTRQGNLPPAIPLLHVLSFR